ncbi:MAG: aspartyl/glutamyl-tRNA amidotransferase subunit C [Silvanigrellaceae bacterium]|nr:aspartyl/glutamyl-tRNA amidotransferase subunit C [Silvanigrellaceae bacterium]
MIDELTKENLQKIAELSRLHLTDDEMLHMQKELLKIIDAFQTIAKCSLPQELESTSRSGLLVKNAHSFSEKASRMRCDEPHNLTSSQEFLAQCPEREGAFVRVPAILTVST